MVRWFLSAISGFRHICIIASVAWPNSAVGVVIRYQSSAMGHKFELQPKAPHWVVYSIFFESRRAVKYWQNLSMQSIRDTCK